MTNHGPLFAFKKEYNEENKLWSISPNTLGLQNKFVIVCFSSDEADEIINRIFSQKLKMPNESLSDWIKVSEIGTIPVYKLQKS